MVLITVSFSFLSAAISIGFQYPQYTFTKGDGYHLDTIRLVKDGGVVSEQTFVVQVSIVSGAVGTQAMYGRDFDIRNISKNPVQTFTIRPDQQNISIPINIYDDGSVTGTKIAKLNSAKLPNSVEYSTSRNRSTIVNILDHHGGFI